MAVLLVVAMLQSQGHEHQQRRSVGFGPEFEQKAVLLVVAMPQSQRHEHQQRRSFSDVIILPSLFEPFGLVYIEAFALKTPVVAFNTPAGNEIMVNNETALLVDKGDSKALAEKIIYLLKNTEERNKITNQAFEKYKNSFTTEIMVKNTAKWYLSLGK